MDTDAAICTICRIRPIREKKKFLFYGIHVCRKCLYRFANRRQAAFVVDSIAWSLVTLLLAGLIGLIVSGWMVPEAVGLAFSFLGSILFLMKDGFSGQSPGKLLCGVQVVDAKSMEPIGFGASFVRNLPILILFMPTYLIRVLGHLATAAAIRPVLIAGSFSILFWIIGLLIIALRLVKGPRWGDGWAGTKVVWKEYAHRVPFDLRGEACTNCGYNLRGNISGVCPECGEAIMHSARPVVGPRAAGTSVEEADVQTGASP